ncbi:hypothetical protein I3760_07G089900 [Carya illinoinensis]|nr:hypothetical protein I3760_07G089900 [Carya illinoinensis]
MDPSTHCDAYFTNLLNNNDFLMSATNEQELSPPQVEVIEIELSGRKTQRGNNFSNEEDLLLVEGWLETSLDVIGKAKEMFLELEKKSFNFDHCWRVLRFHPTWMEHMDMVKLKKKPSSHDSTPNSINLGKDEDFHVASSNLERPIGHKAEKRETKEKRNDKLRLSCEARDHDNKMLCLRQEEVSLRQDELRIQKEKVLLQQVKASLEEKKEDERIMTLNTSATPLMLQQYYLQRQMEILASHVGKN